MATPPASAATTIAAQTTCGNGMDNTGGLGAICETTVENTITATGGSARVTVRECHGAANDAEALCTTETLDLTEPVTVVNQCNDSQNGAGGTLECSVQITNTFVDEATSTTAATVNQCVGSGDGITIGCVPFPATTTGAVITQCNGSANGGTLVGLTCTATGTQASDFQVTINQCNDSGNGGGALVICSSDIDNISDAPSPSASPTATASPSLNLTQPPTDGVASGRSTTETSSPWPVLALLVLIGLAIGSFTFMRRQPRA